MNYLLEYKKVNAKFRFAAKTAKNESLEKFIGSINPCSNPKKLWADIKALSGTYKYTSINILKTPQATINSHPGIANFFPNSGQSMLLTEVFHQILFPLKIIA